MSENFMIISRKYEIKQKGPEAVGERKFFILKQMKEMTGNHRMTKDQEQKMPALFMYIFPTE